MSNDFYVFEVHFIFNNRGSHSNTFLANAPYAIFAPLLLGEIARRELFTLGPMTFTRAELSAVLFIFKGIRTEI